jgi:hypothetical protein
VGKAAIEWEAVKSVAIPTFHDSVEPDVIAIGNE